MAAESVDESFNNRDLDIATVGPIVREISATFDEFWNSESALPIEAFVSEKPTPISPPSGPTQWLFQGPPAESKLLAAKANS